MKGFLGTCSKRITICHELKLNFSTKLHWNWKRFLYRFCRVVVYSKHKLYLKKKVQRLCLISLVVNLATSNYFLRTLYSVYNFGGNVPSKISLNPLWSRATVSTAGPGFEKWNELPFYSRSPRNHVAAKHKGLLMCIVKIWQNHLKFKPISTKVFCPLNTFPLTTIVLIFFECQHRKISFHTFKLQRTGYSKNNFSFAQLFRTERKTSNWYGRINLTGRKIRRRKLRLTCTWFAFKLPAVKKDSRQLRLPFRLQE